MRKFALALVALLLIGAGLRAADVDNPFRPPATTCTNQFIRSLAAITAVGTCATVSLTADVTGIMPPANGGTGVANSVNLTVSSATSVGRGQYQGTNTNDDASAGNIGEYNSATLASGSATSITSNTGKTVTSMSLTAGDWNVSGTVCVTAAVSTVLINEFAGISTVDNTLDALLDRTTQFNYGAGIVPNGGTNCLVVSSARVSLNSTTTVYLVAQALFTTSTATAYGKIHGLRAR